MKLPLYQLDAFTQRLFGGNFVVLEGDWQPTRLVLFQFPNTAAAQALFDDPEYQPLKALRRRVSKTDAIVVEGL